jgi:hypothetical protein
MGCVREVAKAARFPVRKLWHHSGTAELKTERMQTFQRFASDSRIAALHWEKFALAGICNRHCPEYMDDDEIDNALRKMIERGMTCPWE